MGYGTSSIWVLNKTNMGLTIKHRDWSDEKQTNQDKPVVIGLVEWKINRKPLFLPLYMGVSGKVSQHPIL
jgi:hypothetical protein